MILLRISTLSSSSRELQSQSVVLPTTSAIRTSRFTSHAVFGLPSLLPANVLPTNGQVGKYFVYVKERPKAGNKNALMVVTDAIIHLWQTASIPVIQRQSVHKRLSQLINKGSQLCRSKTSTKNHNKFTSTFGQIFDICSCSCKITSTKQSEDVTIQCKCPRDRKVPQQELKFLHDQRTTRRMYIGG